MRFPQFTDQECTIDSSWHGDERQPRLTGTVSSSAPFAILSLLKCGEAFHYMKHSKSSDLEVPLNLYQEKFPHQNLYQHSLMIGNSVNTDGISEGRLFLPGDSPITFHTGQVFAFATDSQNQPFIYLLAIARVDIKSKRCGIWAVKPRLLESIDEPWRHVLTKTRHGWIPYRRHIGKCGWRSGSGRCRSSFR